MVNAWYMDDSNEDRRKDHIGSDFLTTDDIFELTRFEYFSVKDNETFINCFRNERGYTYEDQIIFSDQLPKETHNSYYEEHLHDFDEARLILTGSGFFDVREPKHDKWIRIKVEPGDFIVVPKGAYHRFTVDEGGFAKLRRFFIGAPIWTCQKRPADDSECRKEYLKKVMS